jgi:hypothetical protein
MNWVVNAVLFQLCWVAFVGGAGRGCWWLGFLVLLPFALWQLYVSARPRADALLLLIAAALGFVVDSALAYSGVLSYATPVPWAQLAPIWIVGLWAGFGLTLNHSMVFLQTRPWLALLLGGLAGPFAYWVAARAWSAVALNGPMWQALLALAIAWALITPVLAKLAQNLAQREAARMATP